MQKKSWLRVVMTMVALASCRSAAAQAPPVTIETGIVSGSVDGGVESWNVIQKDPWGAELDAAGSPAPPGR